MEKSSDKKSNIFIIVLAIIVVALVILIVCMLKPKGKNNGSSSANNEPVVINVESTENINYDFNLFYLNSGESFELKIIDGVLKANHKEDQMKVTGIEGKAVSFVSGSNCSGTNEILVITDENKLYYFKYDVNDKNFNEKSEINFKKVDISEKVVDITKHPETGWTTCGESYLAVVLENNEVRALYEDNGNIKLGSFNYDSIAAVYLPIIIYKDNTISLDYTENENRYNEELNEKIKYNNAEIKVDKYIYIGSNKDATKYTSYIVSNDKLYKLELTTEGPKVRNTEITLVNESKIKSESLNVKQGSNHYEYLDSIRALAYEKGKQKDLVKFEKGKSFTIENISSVYSFK